MQGHGSGVNVSIRHWVVRKYAVHEHLHMYVSRSQFSNHPGLGVNFSPESNTTLSSQLLASEYHVRKLPSSEGPIYR